MVLPPLTVRRPDRGRVEAGGGGAEGQPQPSRTEHALRARLGLAAPVPTSPLWGLSRVPINSPILQRGRWVHRE